MRILLDTCIPKSLRVALFQAGHDMECCSDWATDPGDSAIFEYAAANEMVLITLDKDFGELAVRDKRLHCGLVRVEAMPFAQMASQTLEALNFFAEEMQSGCYVVVTASGCRVRRP